MLAPTPRDLYVVQQAPLKLRNCRLPTHTDEASLATERAGGGRIVLYLNLVNIFTDRTFNL